MKFRNKTLKFVVITKVPDIVNGHFGNAGDLNLYRVKDKDEEGDEVLVAGYNEFISPIHNLDGTDSYVKVEAFYTGDILICEDHDGYLIEVGRQRKPHKWAVEYEVFDDIIEALEKARSLE